MRFRIHIGTIQKWKTARHCFCGKTAANRKINLAAQALTPQIRIYWYRISGLCL